MAFHDNELIHVYHVSYFFRRHRRSFDVLMDRHQARLMRHYLKYTFHAEEVSVDEKRQQAPLTVEEAYDLINRG